MTLCRMACLLHKSLLELHSAEVSLCSNERAPHIETLCSTKQVQEQGVSKPWPLPELPACTCSLTACLS